ncbi:hypothetical protein [Bradyrhizobium sp. CCBAU 53421]|uniref:hypothetical protein n=1 Tax=Bradyrhizobium sp. CCBAU 53421 TaxID=1325120 RepID=UPI00188C77F7|nr:hypothetical protein [Bradyrhizobium sp. CCBAU 53421]
MVETDARYHRSFPRYFKIRPSIEGYSQPMPSRTTNKLMLPGLRLANGGVTADTREPDEG